MVVLALLDVRQRCNGLLAAELAAGAVMLALLVWLILLPAVGAPLHPEQAPSIAGMLSDVGRLHLLAEKPAL